MRILHLTKKYPNAIGGDATVVKNLEIQQKISGHKVYIVAANCDEISNNCIKFGLKTSTQNLDKISIKRIVSLFILLIKSFRLLKRIKPDVVHSHSTDMGFIMSFACKKYDIPLINTCHGVIFNDKQYSFFKRKLELFLLKNASFSKVITVDQNSLEGFKKYGINKVIYIPNGIDLEHFKTIRTIKEHKDIRIIFVGRLEKQKGLTYLIKSINILKNIELELIIIGDGSQTEKLRNLVKHYGLENRVRFLGNMSNDNVIDELYKSDIFVLPSIWEGFPLTILEAWAAELPVIVTNVGGISKICKNNENAIIIPPKNINRLTYSLLKLINDKNLRERLGSNGYILVISKYSWKNNSAEIENVYNEVFI